jgi:hypothetical protein
MTKEKFIGLVCYGVAALLVWCEFHPLMLPLVSFNHAAIPIKPFLMPAMLIAIGWLKLHGPEPLKRWHHHSHWLAGGMVAAIIIGVMLYFHSFHIQ